MTTKERFIEYLKVKGTGQTAFEESAGLSRGSISQKSGFSANSIEKIAVACPELNIDWLITGKGSMLKSEASTPQSISSNPALIEELKEEISALKAENNQLKGENKILREIAGLKERKELGEQSA